MGNEGPRGGRKAVQDAEIRQLKLENLRLIDELMAARLRILELMPQHTPPTTTPVSDEPESLHPAVEGEIEALWGDMPQAAQMSRAIALSRFRAGMDPKRLADLIRRNGETVD
jgi:hypothetical protein